MNPAFSLPTGHNNTPIYIPPSIQSQKQPSHQQFQHPQPSKPTSTQKSPYISPSDMLNDQSSMTKNIFATLLLCFCFTTTFGQYLQWAGQIGGPKVDYFPSITRDAANNVILTGVFVDSCDIDPGPGVTMLLGNTPNDPFKQDNFLAKYDPNGNLLWGFVIGGTDGDAVWTVKTDANDDIYIAATYSGTIDFDPGPGTTSLTSATAGAEIYVAKYSKTGQFVWVRDLRGHQHGDNRARDIAFDGMGNLYLAGDFQGSIDIDVGAGQDIIQSSAQGGNSDFVIVKMDTAGNYLWGFTVGGPCLAEAIDVDGNGDVYITGSLYGSADFDPGTGTDIETKQGSRDMFVAGYTSAGAYKWAGLYSSPGNNYPRDVVCDANNNVIFTGIYSETIDLDPGPFTSYLTSNFNGVDGLIVKLTAAGGLVWGHTVGGGSSDWIQAVTVDASNNIYLVPQANGTYDIDLGPGTVNYTNTVGRFPLVKYDANANYVSHFELFTRAGAKSVRSIFADAQGNITAAGHFSDTLNCAPSGDPAYDMPEFGDDDIYMASYSSSPVSVDEGLAANSINAYPNPFSEQVNVAFEGDQSGSWRLLDISGRVVKAGEFHHRSQVQMELGHLPAAMYVLQVELENGERLMQKLVAR